MTDEFEYWACAPDVQHGYVVERRTLPTKKALDKEIKNGLINSPGMPSTDYGVAAQQVIQQLEARQTRLKTETKDLLPDLRYRIVSWFRKARWNIQLRREAARQLKQAKKIWGNQ